MAVVVREILLCLFLAALLGAAIGWAARGLRSRRLWAGEAAAAQRALEEARGQLRLSDSALAAGQRTVTELQADVDTGRRQLEALRQELKETLMARDTARHDTLGTRDQLSKVSAQAQEAVVARDALRAELDACRAALTAARTRTGEVEGQRDALRRESEELRAAQGAASQPDEVTRQRLETLRATLQAAERGWDNARAQAEAAQQHLETTRRQLAHSEVDRHALGEQMATVQAELETSRRRGDVAQTSHPEPTLANVYQEIREPQPKTERDDLQRIKGIGPVLERTLHRAGIYRYAQIATWTREEILAIAERLPGFHDRIMRDRWPTAARRLHLAKYGSPP
jgi:predicted flap endonuclease-1-like 5' DNA nuclease